MLDINLFNNGVILIFGYGSFTTASIGSGQSETRTITYPISFSKYYGCFVAMSVGQAFKASGGDRNKTSVNIVIRSIHTSTLTNQTLSYTYITIGS